MNKYEIALDEIGSIVLDKNSDGHETPRCVRDFYFSPYGALQGLVNKAESFEWIPVSERLPEEHDSVFAELYGTDKWDSGLWRTTSDRVFVTIKYDDGIKIVKNSCLRDGEWRDEKLNNRCKVIAWMPLPEPYKEKENE